MKFFFAFIFKVCPGLDDGWRTHNCRNVYKRPQSNPWANCSRFENSNMSITCPECYQKRNKSRKRRNSSCPFKRLMKMNQEVNFYNFCKNL